MKVSIHVVGNSKWSKLISLFLYVVSLCGIVFVLTGLIGIIEAVLKGELIDISIALALVVMGLVIVVAPYVIYLAVARYVNYLRIKKEVKERGLEPVVRTSMEVALQLYAKEPGRPLLQYIETLNPKAAELIIRENPYAMETKSQMVKRRAGLYFARVKRKHDAKSKCWKIRRKAGYGSLVAGIVILILASVYNSKYKYGYEYVPVTYEKYLKNLELNAYAEMNIVAAVMIGKKEEVLTGANQKPIGSSSFAGLYYYVVDDEEDGGIVYFPVNILKNKFGFQESVFGDAEYECEIDVPVQVYGHIEETPHFSNVLNVAKQYSDHQDNWEEYRKQRSQEQEELIRQLSEYVLLSVESLRPMESKEKVRTGNEVSDSWIGVGILLLIVSLLLLRKKHDASDGYFES